MMHNKCKEKSTAFWIDRCKYFVRKPSVFSETILLAIVKMTEWRFRLFLTDYCTSAIDIEIQSAIGLTY